MGGGGVSGLFCPRGLPASKSESLSSSGSRQLWRQSWSLGPVRPSPGASVAFYSLHLHGSALGLAPLLEGSPQSQTTPCLRYGVDLGQSKPAAHMETSTLLPHTSESVCPVFWSDWAHFLFSHPPESAASTTNDSVYQGNLLPTSLCHTAFSMVAYASDNQFT